MSICLGIFGNLRGIFCTTYMLSSLVGSAPNIKLAFLCSSLSSAARQLGTVSWGTASATATHPIFVYLGGLNEKFVCCKMLHIKRTWMGRWGGEWARLVVGQCAHIYMHIKWPDGQLTTRGMKREGQGATCFAGSICFGCPWSLLGKRLSRQWRQASRRGAGCNWNTWSVVKSGDKTQLGQVHMLLPLLPRC